MARSAGAGVQLVAKGAYDGRLPSTEMHRVPTVVPLWAPLVTQKQTS